MVTANNTLEDFTPLSFRIHDSVRLPSGGATPYNPPSESLLRLPNTPKVAHDIVLRIIPPEIVEEYTTYQYPQQDRYFTIPSVPDVPVITRTFCRDAFDLNDGLDLYDPGPYPPATLLVCPQPPPFPVDALTVLSVQDKVKILDKTYFLGTDYTFDTAVTGGINWINPPPDLTPYNLNVYYSTEEYNRARISAGLMELELFPLTYHTGSFSGYRYRQALRGETQYVVEYYKIPKLTDAERTAIATDPTVFDYRNLTQPFQIDRWMVPIRFRRRTERLDLELEDLTAVLQVGFVIPRLPIWTHEPSSPSLRIHDVMTSNSDTDILVPLTIGFVMTPEGLLWENDMVVADALTAQEITDGVPAGTYKDQSLYKVTLDLEYQPATPLSEIKMPKPRQDARGYGGYPRFYFFGIAGTTDLTPPGPAAFAGIFP